MVTVGQECTGAPRNQAGSRPTNRPARVIRRPPGRARHRATDSEQRLHVAFVKTYLAVVRQDEALREHLKDQLVEDPVAKIRFPKYLAASTLERDGRTYYFVDEDTRREFEKQPAAR